MNSYRGAFCWMHESLNVVTELTCRCHVERLYLVVSEYTGWVECLVFNVTYYTRKYDNLQMLKDCSERENFAENITTKISRIKPTGEVEQDWNETKTLLCDAIEETVGFKWKPG